jgi:MtaA/CmuA family methyltransferase
MNGRQRILALLDRQPVDRPPVMPITMQFAADLIGARYVDYEMDYRVLVEGQIRTAERFGIDHVNIMSDPAREAADLGARVHYPENAPASIDSTDAVLADPSRLNSLAIPEPASTPRMHNALLALASYKEKAGGEKMIEGWVEGPCAQAANLRGISRLMTDFLDDPSFVADILDFAVDLALRFARAQIEAGADVIGVGDAAASLVGPRIYREFIRAREKRLVDGIHDAGGKVRLHICGNTRPLLADIGRLGCDIVDLDWLTPVAEAREKMGPEVVLLGNVNPVAIMRDSRPDEIARAIADCHRAAGDRYIVGAGCEVPRDTPFENLEALRDYSISHAARPERSDRS